MLREILASSTLVVVLAVLLALLAAAVLIAAADEDVQRSAGYLFGQPNDFVYYLTHSIGDAFKALFYGSVFNPEAGTAVGAVPADHRDPDVLGAADLRRPRARHRLPRRPVQHRRPGPDHPRRGRRRLRRLRDGPAARAAPAARRGRRVRRRRGVGRHRRLPQGPHRRQRGHRHDHAQLGGAVPDRLPAHHRPVPGRVQQPADQPAHPRAARSTRCCWAPASACTRASCSRWSRRPRCGG